MSKAWESCEEIIVETYLSGKRGKSGQIRVRPVEGQKYDTSLNVECSKKMRHRYPVGSKLKLRVLLTDKEGGTPFLYSRYDWPYKVLE